MWYSFHTGASSRGVPISQCQARQPRVPTPNRGAASLAGVSSGFDADRHEHRALGRAAASARRPRARVPRAGTPACSASRRTSSRPCARAATPARTAAALVAQRRDRRRRPGAGRPRRLPVEPESRLTVAAAASADAGDEPRASAMRDRGAASRARRPRPATAAMCAGRRRSVEEPEGMPAPASIRASARGCLRARRRVLRGASVTGSVRLEGSTGSSDEPAPDARRRTRSRARSAAAPGTAADQRAGEEAGDRDRWHVRSPSGSSGRQRRRRLDVPASGSSQR